MLHYAIGARADAGAAVRRLGEFSGHGGCSKRARASMASSWWLWRRVWMNVRPLVGLRDPDLPTDDVVP